MIQLFRWLWSWARWLVRLIVLPAYRKTREFRGFASGLLWTLHVIIILAILAGLTYAQYKTEFLSHALPDAPKWIQQYFWLPLIFLFLYVLVWLGFWLWKLLTEEDVSDFPDIDEAWDEAVRALDKAGIDVREAPLFLILGRTAAREESLFSAAQLELRVKQAPQRATSPLHVSANRDAIFVTCAGASLLGRHAALLQGEGDAASSAFPGNGPGTLTPAADEMTRTMRADEPGPATLAGGGENNMGKIQQILAQAEREGRKPGELLEEERRRIRELERRDRPRPNLLGDTAQAEELAARLKHLCRLIVRDRRPYCSVNGILLLLPFAGTDSEADVGPTGLVCQRDLAAAREALQVHCPIFVMACDMETAPGFPDFIAAFSPAERRRRVGQRFPFVAELEPVALQNKVEEGVRFIFHALLPSRIYKFFRVETAGGAGRDECVAANTRLFRLMAEARARQDRFGRVVGRAVSPEAHGALLYGGCYIAATGDDSNRDQAFVAGVFHRLPESQNYVTWTPEAVQEEETYQWWTRLGYIALGVFVAVVFAICVKKGYDSKGPSGSKGKMASRAAAVTGASGR